MMGKEMIFGAFFILLWTGTASAQDITIAEVMKHVTRLESTISLLEQKHADDIEALEDKANRREAEFRAQIYDLVQKHHAEIKTLKESAEVREADLQASINSLNQRVGGLEQRTTEPDTIKTMPVRELPRSLSKEDIKQPQSAGQAKSERSVEILPEMEDNSMDAGQTSGQWTAQAKRATSPYHVAFSAYMDHDADFSGVGQTLVINHVLLNHGNGYNQYTGTFTAPLDGVYYFTFFIGERDTHQAFVRLYHNNIQTVSAVAQTDSDYEDAQGGNAVILELRAGDVMYLVNEVNNDHIEGSNVYSTTTFSGFLLYPSQSGGVSVVV